MQAQKIVTQLAWLSLEYYLLIRTNRATTYTGFYWEQVYFICVLLIGPLTRDKEVTDIWPIWEFLTTFINDACHEKTSL